MTWFIIIFFQIEINNVIFCSFGVGFLIESEPVGVSQSENFLLKEFYSNICYESKVILLNIFNSIVNNIQFISRLKITATSVWIDVWLVQV